MNNWKPVSLILVIFCNLLFMLTGCNSEKNNAGNSIPKTIETSLKGVSDVSLVSMNRTVTFTTYEVNKKYYNEIKGYAELQLKLPQLVGNYNGIPQINKYFIGKEEFFYDELPLDILREANRKVEGANDNWYRSANYKLEAIWGDIISISAELNGGAGGVGWPGKEGNVFNLNTGDKLILRDIFKVGEEEYMKLIYDFVAISITNEIRDSKLKGYGSGYDFDDAYSDKGYKTIKDNFEPDHFYLTDKALVVFYPQHALRGGPTGPIIFEIPYESISNIMAIKVS